VFARVVLTRAAHAAVADAVRAAWPCEMAAVLGGHEQLGTARVDTVVCHPESELRPDAFSLDPVGFARAEYALRSTGRRWLGFAHSHPNGTALPSLRDRAELWRGCVQLIAASDGATVTFGAFELGSDPAAVTALPLAIEGEA
jgi:proteasome lid subunit RPN8/RPN11